MTVFLVGSYRIWVLCCLWAWFLVPIGAPEVTYPQALGVVAGWLLMRGVPQELVEPPRERVLLLFGLSGIVHLWGYLLMRIGELL